MHVAPLALLLAAAGEIPRPGAEVPEFRMADPFGRFVSSRSLRGQRYLLAFYPKDFTPG